MAAITQRQFRSRVLAHKGDGLTESTLNYAVQLCLKKDGMLREEYIYSCVKLAEALEGYYQQRLREDGLQSQRELVPQPLPARGSHPVGELITSDVVVEWLTPHVEQLREELFGSPAQPFPTYEAAVEWLVRQGNAQWRRWQERNEQKQRECRQKSGSGGLVLFRELHETAILQAQKKAGAVFHISSKRRRIPYLTSREDLIPDCNRQFFLNFRKWYPDIFPGVEQCLWSIDIHEDSVLAKLEDAAYKIADAAGFDKRDVIAWILAGDKPTIPPFRMHNEYKELKLPDKQTLENRYVVIEVLEPEHLTYNQFKQLYYSIRADFNVTRVKALTVPHQRLRDIVKRLGGVPTKHGSKRIFWERVRQEWNREMGREEYPSWRSLEMKYNRLIKKLKLSDQQGKSRR